MQYKDINKTIISSKEVSPLVQKNKEFYDYLLANNVAYYYATKVSTATNEYESEIIKTGDSFNNQMFKTLQLVKSVCEENNIEFALFKTYKHIPEAVDGDVDLFVREKDFYRFLELMKNNGFACFEDAPLKGRCEKEGYAKLEPRVTVSFHGMEVFGEAEVWKNITEVTVGDLKVLSASKGFDALCLLLNGLYGPKYLRLYLYLLAKDIPEEEMLNIASKKALRGDISFVYKELLSEKSLSKKFPLFLGDTKFFEWWLKRIAFNPSYNLKGRARHLAFFYFSKYKYLLFNRLHFEHKWL